MSAKPRVYQGVRVKMTVKELLQQRRALQAERNASEIQEGRIEFSDPFPSSSEMYSGCQAIPSEPSCNYQTRELPNYVSQEDSLSFVDQLLLNAYLQPDPPAENTFNFMQNPSIGYPEDNIMPAPIFNQSMTPESLSDSSDISNSFEYSPSHQEIAFAPQRYSSPSFQDPASCAFANDYCQQQNGSTFCYCQYCCSLVHQGSMKTQGPYSYTNTDCLEYVPSSTITEDFFSREINSFDMCYS